MAPSYIFIYYATSSRNKASRVPVSGERIVSLQKPSRFTSFLGLLLASVLSSGFIHHNLKSAEPRKVLKASPSGRKIRVLIPRPFGRGNFYMGYQEEYDEFRKYFVRQWKKTGFFEIIQEDVAHGQELRSYARNSYAKALHEGKRFKADYVLLLEMTFQSGPDKMTAILVEISSGRAIVIEKISMFEGEAESPTNRDDITIAFPDFVTAIYNDFMKKSAPLFQKTLGQPIALAKVPSPPRPGTALQHKASRKSREKPANKKVETRSAQTIAKDLRSLAYKTEKGILIDAQYVKNKLTLDYEDNKIILYNGIIPIHGNPFSPGHNNLKTSLKKPDNIHEIGMLHQKKVGSTFYVNLVEEWNSDFCMEWFLKGKIQKLTKFDNFLDAVLVKLEGKSISECGTSFSIWNVEGRRFIGEYIIAQSNGLLISANIKWTDNTGLGWGNKYSQIIKLSKFTHARYKAKTFAELKLESLSASPLQKKIGLPSTIAKAPAPPRLDTTHLRARRETERLRLGSRLVAKRKRFAGKKTTIGRQSRLDAQKEKRQDRERIAEIKRDQGKERLAQKRADAKREEKRKTAQFQKGLSAYKRGNYATSLHEWKSLAEQRYARGQNALGVMYRKGRAVPRDYKTALKWFTLAAKQGYAAAQTNLGVMYAKGESVPQNYKTALKWFTLAAKQDYARGQNAMGVVYRRGQGIPRNYKTALKWFTLAAKQGYPTAQGNLGTMYHKGQGVPKNNKTALKWFNLAAKQGRGRVRKRANKDIARIQSQIAKGILSKKKIRLRHAETRRKERERKRIAKRRKEYRLKQLAELRKREDGAQSRLSENRRRKKEEHLARLERELKRKELRLKQRVKEFEKKKRQSRITKRTSPETQEDWRSSGSGFYLKGSTHIMTNHHVIEKARVIQVSFPKGKRYRGRVVATDKRNDLAVVKLLKMRPRHSGFGFRYGVRVQVGERIHALGYPLGASLSRNPSMVSGEISSTTGKEDDLSQFRMTAPINAGNSGGPIVNDKGELVGIAKGGHIQRGVEAVRFGIKTSAAGIILEQIPTSANFDIQVRAQKRKNSPSQIFRELSPYVVMIEIK